MTSAVEAKPEDTLAIANRLRPVLLHLNRHLRREVHAAGVSAGQVSLLVSLRDTPGIGVAELAAREGTSMPSVSAHIDRLEAAGLVARLRDAAPDRRRVGITVTPEGLRVLRTIRSKRTAWLAARLASVSEADRAAIAAAVEPLAALGGHTP